MKKLYIFALATILTIIMIACSDGSGSNSSTQTDSHTKDGGGVGVGGSMARFAINGNLLYTLNERALQSFDISDPEAPLVYTDTTNLSSDVETLFSDGTYLYVGGRSGMDIYDENLTRLGSVSHFKSCDPVVVQNDLAFVTLNTSNSCRIKEGKNALQVYDVKNPLKPELIYTQRTYMSGPTGLGIDGETLFVCDGKEGLKVFDVNTSKNDETNKSIVTMQFNRKSSIKDINCYDLIAHKELLIVSNGENVRQFDYSHLPMIEYNNSR